MREVVDREIGLEAIDRLFEREAAAGIEHQQVDSCLGAFVENLPANLADRVEARQIQSQRLSESRAGLRLPTMNRSLRFAILWAVTNPRPDVAPVMTVQPIETINDPSGH